MTLLAPLSLLALVPWAALAAWAWRGRAVQASVPFVRLWPGTPTPSGATERRRPPWRVLLLLAAALLAILASSGPRIDAVERWTTLRATLVVDRGLTMAPGNRLANTLARAERLLNDAARHVKIEVVPVPPGPAEEVVAVDTGAQLHRVVAERLRREELVVVVSDQAVLEEAKGATAPDAGRLVQVAPTDAVANAGLVAIDAGDGGARIVVRNDSLEPATSARLQITTNLGHSARPVVLPARGETTAVLIDLPDGTDVVTAKLDVGGDDWLVDDAFSVALQRAWPSIEVRGDVPAPVGRMVDVYSRLRPAMPWSRRVIVSMGEFPPHMAGVRMAPATEAADALRPTEAFQPLMGVAWNRLTSPRVATDAPKGWRTVLETTEGRPAMAVRDDDQVRQVWLGFDADGFAGDVAFVRLWADLLTWVNGGEPTWGWEVTGGPQTTPAEARQGIVRAANGKPRALNLPRATLGVASPAAATAERPDAVRAVAAHREGATLAPWLLGVAVALSVIAAGIGAMTARNGPVEVSRGRRRSAA